MDKVNQMLDIPTKSKEIQTTKKVFPQIYAYIIPGSEELKGWVKIGYTERENVEDRIKEQVHTAGIKHVTLWKEKARKVDDGEWFTDHDLHRYLSKMKGLKRMEGREWFYYGVGNEDQAHNDFIDFIGGEIDQSKGENDYELRAEQESAVKKTLDFIESGEDNKFLWNAKPRFGKTLTAYDLARKMEARNVLVMTQRPSIANSWFDDFEKFIAWQTNYKFVSGADALKTRAAITYEEFEKNRTSEDDMIAFVSLADLKGSTDFGGEYKKLKWVKETEWDLIIIDEAHEAVDTFQTTFALDNLTTKFTLHLSGTPFKAVANGKFEEDQIFNWTYQDEQRAKADWSDPNKNNPYEKLPRLNMYSYRMGDAIVKEVSKGILVDGENLDYTFDLHEFFATNNSGRLIYENDVIMWLDTLTTNEKYPFSTKKLRDELKHTFWFLQRVDSAKALKKLLEAHPVFENYKIVLAAGDGKTSDDSTEYVSRRSLDKVKEAIAANDKTITLSVGQLTTGVTIPEWTAVLMLSNVSSPALYMQAAFRSQNPWTFEDSEGNIRQKKDAYVFDFAPARSLEIIDDFANNLSSSTASGGGTTASREENVKELINFLPVIAEDTEGTMHQLNVNEIFTIPQAVRAQEVVRQGFMSNLLFQNTTRVFMNDNMKKIVDKMSPAEGNTRRVNKNKKPIDTKKVKVDENGKAKVDNTIVVNENKATFGEKVYKDTSELINERINDVPNEDKKVVETAYKEHVQQKAKEFAKEQGLTVNEANKIVDRSSSVIVDEFDKLNLETKVAISEVDEKMEDAISDALAQNRSVDEAIADIVDEKEIIEIEYRERITNEFPDKMKEATEAVTKSILEEIERKKQREVESEVKSRLRGFSRTIPSFLMAYGTRETTLANFDTILSDEVFEGLTGITLDDFRELRDTYNLFNEVVFNESVQEFFNKKEELGNYFIYKEEDIFDLIPPQQTNQIFTPKWVASYQLDLMEAEEPNLFKDKSRIFCDLYVKSGVYLAEVAKRLYEGLRDEIPDDNERIHHILENQIYGFAPTEIIYNIAKNYIFGFDDIANEIDNLHIVHLDTLPFAREQDVEGFWNQCGELFRLKDMKYLNKGDNEMKFDVIVGNPPYQGEATSQIYPRFYILSRKLGDIVGLIFPTGWMLPRSTNGLSLMNTKEIKQDKQIIKIEILRDIFLSIDGAKEVNVIVWKRGFDNNLSGKQKIIDLNKEKIREIPYNKDLSQKPPELVSLLSSVQKKGENEFVVSKGSPYGIETNFMNNNTKNIIYYRKRKEGAYKLISKEKGNGTVILYVDSDFQVNNKSTSIDNYKVFIPGNWGNMDEKTFIGGSYSNIILASPNVMCTKTWVESGDFDTKEKAEIHAKYILTKFFRSLLYLNKDTLVCSRLAYKYIPQQDYSEPWWNESIEEIDEHLFDKYDIPEDIRQYVRDNIQPRTEDNIDDFTEMD